jgi:hypothetical protein
MPPNPGAMALTMAMISSVSLVFSASGQASMPANS